jgi:hypothetical protein
MAKSSLITFDPLLAPPADQQRRHAQIRSRAADDVISACTFALPQSVP